jgi:hypothetical protein
MNVIDSQDRWLHVVRVGRLHALPVVIMAELPDGPVSLSTRQQGRTP